jgi:hypothetical protein
VLKPPEDRENSHLSFRSGPPREENLGPINPQYSSGPGGIQQQEGICPQSRELLTILQILLLLYL